MLVRLLSFLAPLCASVASATPAALPRARQPAANQQPEAPSPPPSQHRSLPWGAINFISTTDVHGWLEGHIKEPFYSADWGDVYSFVHHMKAKARREGRDLLVVDSGDLHDGTGLSDTTPRDGEITDEIFKYMDYDLLSVGNHELYVGEITKAMSRYFVPRYRGRYLTSNVNITLNGSSTPLGARYRKFKTPVNNYTILAFGILFDFKGNDKSVSTCQPVHLLVQEPWFQSVLKTETSDIDLIVVVGHTPLHRSSEYDVVLAEIRRHLPSIPVQFFGGHSHIRDFKKYDDSAHGIQSGRYLETLGFIGMDIHPQVKVGRRYIDNNLASYQFHTGISSPEDFNTVEGKEISSLIEKKVNYQRDEQKLRTVLACIPKDYYVSRVPYPSNDSVYSLLVNDVFPKLVFNGSCNPHRLILLNTGAIRFDLFSGNFTLDDGKITSPFKNPFLVLRDVRHRDAKVILDWLNTGKWGYILDDDEDHIRDQALRQSWEKYLRQQEQEQPRQHRFTLDAALPGYVTHDDFGSDGDDTIHSPLPYYPVPYYVQSAIVPPEIQDSDPVDVIFTGFTAPAVIGILNEHGSSGRTYTLNELEQYQNDPVTLTNVFERYSKIEESWMLNEFGTCV